MTTPTTIGRLGLIATLVASCAIAQAMELRDLPDWVRDRIWLVEVDWQALADEPVAEPTTVHLVPRAPSPAGLGVSSPVNLGAPTVTTPGGGVSVAAPGFATGGGVHVPGFAGDAAGATGVRAVTADAAPTLGGGVHVPGFGLDVGGGIGVRAGSAAEITGIGGVHVEAMGAEWDEALASIEGLDQETLAQGGQILGMIREQDMSPEQFAAWATQHQVTPEVLTAGLLMVGVHRHDNYPTPQPDALVLASGLEALAGEGLSQIDAVPPFGRLWLAILLGRRGDDAGALTAFDSMSDEQLVALPRETAVMTIAHLMRDVPRTAVPAIKLYAVATNQRAMWCFDLYLVCKRLGDSDLVRDELIPWTEEALTTPGSQGQWDIALPALLWAYQYVGEAGNAIERGRYWLADAEQRNIAPYALSTSRMRLAKGLTLLGELREAVDLLRSIAADSSTSRLTAARAQCQLLELAAGHEQIGEVRIIAPAFVAVRPSHLRASFRAGNEQRADLTVTGNVTFEVMSAVCDLPQIGATVRQTRMDATQSRYEVELSVLPVAPGVYEGSVVIRTNDVEHAQMSVPIALRVLPPITIEPEICFWGFIRPGEARTWGATLSSTMPFAITGIEVDHPDLIGTTVAKNQAGSYTVQLRFEGSDQPGAIEGSIHVLTDLVTQPRVAVPYYAHVAQEE